MFRSNPDVFYESRDLQMRHFIEFMEIGARGRKVVIVIDGLDVCVRERYEVSNFLSALGKVESGIRDCDLKIFIASRPLGLRSRQGFLRLQNKGVATPTSSALHEVEPEDMRLFLNHGLSEHGRTQTYQPTEDELNLLSQYVGGFFPYAAEAVKFIQEGTQLPQKQLDLLLSSPEKIYLDSLYGSILKKVIEELDPVKNRLQYVHSISILAAISHATNPISPPTIAILLNLEAYEVPLYLDLFRSLFTLREDGTVQPVHHSLITFLTNRHLHRTNQDFYVNPLTLHKNLLIGCIRLINLNHRQEGNGGDFRNALEYANKSYHQHLYGAIGTVYPELSPCRDELLLCWDKLDRCLDDKERGQLHYFFSSGYI